MLQLMLLPYLAVLLVYHKDKFDTFLDFGHLGYPAASASDGGTARAALHHAGFLCLCCIFARLVSSPWE